MLSQRTQCCLRGNSILERSQCYTQNPKVTHGVKVIRSCLKNFVFREEEMTSQNVVSFVVPVSPVYVEN